MSLSVFLLAIFPAGWSLTATCLDQSASANDGSAHRCLGPDRGPLLRTLGSSDSYRSVSLVLRRWT